MPWNQFWKRSHFKRGSEPSDESPAQADTPKHGHSQALPPHLASAVAGRKRPPVSEGSALDERQRRLDALQRRRIAILYDVGQGERARDDGNPWQNRIELLTEAITTVTDDLSRLATAPRPPYHPVPPTPLAIERVEGGANALVILRIGDQRFEYSEEPDWAERGHQITRAELVRQSGDPARLLPDDTPPELRSDLERHLANSLFVLATDLRDRLLDNEPLPAQITLADLAKPCPECGGWMDWRGTCQACAQRNAAIAELKREEIRLLDERAAEAEERHRLVERLSMGRRRLHDVEIEIAALSADPGKAAR